MAFEIVHTLPSYTPGRFPKLTVWELPFMFTNPTATNHAITDFAAEYMADELANFHLIGVHVHGGDALHVRGKNVESLADLKGLKIRVASGTIGRFMEALGAIPIGAPIPAVPQLLSRGVIDGVWTPFEIMVAFKAHEMTDSHVVLGAPGLSRPSTGIFLFLMNKKTYDSMPADLQAIIDESGGHKIAGIAGEKWTAFEARGLEITRETGNPINVWSDADLATMREAAKPLYASWVEEMNAAGHDGAEMLARAEELLKKYTQEHPN